VPVLPLACSRVFVVRGRVLVDTPGVGELLDQEPAPSGGVVGFGCRWADLGVCGGDVLDVLHGVLQTGLDPVTAVVGLQLVLATDDLATGGRWAITVTASRPGLAPATATLDWIVPPAEAFSRQPVYDGRVSVGVPAR
jgi:hypothetical protein